ERGPLGVAALQHAPPGVEAGNRHAASLTKRPHGQPAGLPLADPTSPLTFFLLVPRSAVGHDNALPLEGLDHSRQYRDPPDGDPETMAPVANREAGEVK